MSDSATSQATTAPAPAPVGTSHAGAAPGATAASAAAASAPTLLGRVTDAVLDTSVVSFAVWTLLYSLGLATQWSLWPSGWIWLGVTVLVLGWELRRALRTHTGDEPGVAPAAPAWPVVDSWLDERREALLLGVGLVLVAAAGVGGLMWTPSTFRATWGALSAGLVVLAVWAFLQGRARVRRSDPEPARRGRGGRSTAGRPGRLVRPAELVVLGAALLVAVAASLIHLNDTDDPYYLNRSVWVAERGNAALRDTMFSPEVYNSAYGGGVPIPSVEALFGVIAHMTGQLAGTIVYLVVPPVAAVLAVLALWRLVRRWAPRRPLWVLLGALAFLLLSGDSMLGNFWIPRIWQGKVIAVAVLIPLIWAYLTELADATDRRTRRRLVVLLLMAGIGFFGLTPTATVWAPLMLGAVLVAALAVRSRALALGGAAMTVGPALSGLAVVVFSTDVGGEEPVPLPARASFVRVFGDDQVAMVALGLVALGLAVVLTRRGPAAALAGAATTAAVLVYVPGVLSLVNTVTGSGPILWRMLFVAPVPVLVGLLLAAPAPDLSRLRSPVDAVAGRAARVVPLATAAVVVAGLALGGLPIWAYTGHNPPVRVDSSPQWKLDLPALRDVEKLVDAGVTGTVLLPPRRMKVLTMYSTQAFPVVPRHWFIRNIQEPPEARRARLVLFDVAAGRPADALPGRPRFPGPETTGEALRTLSVDLACVGTVAKTERVMKLYAAAGYDDRVRYGTLHCARPTP